MKLRILIVSDNYPPFIGGAHRQTQLLGRELCKRGHHVQVATLWHPDVPAHEDDQGMQVHRLKQLRNVVPWFVSQGQQYQPPFPDPVTTWRLWRLIQAFQPDVIHAYGWITYSVVVALWGKQIPILLSARDYGYGCATRTLVLSNGQACSGPGVAKCITCASQLYGAPKGLISALGVALGRFLLRQKVKGVHNISTYVQEMVRRDFLGYSPQDDLAVHGITEVVIPSFLESNPVQPNLADPEIQRHLALLPTEKYILFVGALRRIKGVYQLLEAYQRLQNPPPLVLLGTREFDSPREFPPGVVVIPGAPHPVVMAAWQRALFGVIPSLLSEPLGSVVYEGMICGKALIGTKPGGHTDMIVDGETGLLAPKGDVDALTTAMQHLLDNPELCAQFGVAAGERARQFTADVNVPRFEQIYWQLVNQTAGRVDGNKRLQLNQR